MSLATEEIKSVQGLISFLPEEPVIFDIGANKGIWSDVILEEYGKKQGVFHFFEPNPIMLNFCKIKYDYNENIIFNEMAVTDNNKSAKFYFFEDFHNGLSSLYDNKEWQQFDRKEKEVKCVTIDTYCKIHSIEQIDFLKVDVEGADVTVFNGAKKMLEKDAIKIIQFEYSPHYQLGNHKFQDIIDICVPLGYKFYSFDGERYVEVDTNNFVEDYRFENFFITKYLIPNQNENWNMRFKENTQDLGKFHLVMEVGCNEGLTSKYICENMLEGKDARLVCVDPLADYYKVPGDVDYFKDQYQRFIRNTKGLPIDLIREKSEDAFPKLRELRFNLIYIDGDHSSEAVFKDGCSCFELCKIGGYILFDDYSPEYDYGNTHNGIQKFLQRNRNCFEIVKENYQLLIRKIKEYDPNI